MAESVGQIGLDLVVNKNDFDRQMAGIQSMAKKAGLALAAAFSVKKLVDFSASCIELGSDLQEVQNVVDVTFPRMTKQVNDFARSAASSFGLSEIMAKKFTGTFGAMAKAFGFNEKAAYDMSTALTGLSGDVASFYNISQDEAYTKLKSVFTGETESLKDLGVVMTQAALDQYALANGYGKTVQAMGEAEKVALRYKFVTDQLSLASGDFIRTSDGWANQVRVLKLQFDSLKATIGQGLINVLTPVIKVINTIIGKLMSLANAFKAFTELITGKKGSGGTSVAASGMDALAKSADGAGTSMGGAGEAAKGAGGAAKKAAKDIKGATTGIDELNIIQTPDAASDSGGGSGGAGGGGGYAADEFDMGELAEGETVVESKYQGLIDKVKELQALFKVGFQVGFGDVSVLDSIQQSIEGIKTSLKGIFTDPVVISAADNFAKQVSYSLGQVAGSISSVGATIADNLLGGINRYLSQNSQKIKGWLVSMFDIGSEVAAISGRFAEATAEIFSVFRSEPAKQIAADIIGIFSEAITGTTKLLAKFGRDIINVIAKPIIDNKDQIKKRIEGLLTELQPIVSNIKELLGGIFDKLNEGYDKFAKPVLDGLAEAFSSIVWWCTNTQSNFDIIVGSIAAFFGAWQVVKLGEFVINAGGVVGMLRQMTVSLAASTTGFITHTAAILADKIESAAIVALYAKDFVVNLAKGTVELVKQAAQFTVNTAAKLADAAAQGAMTLATSIWNGVCGIATTLTTALGAAIAFLTSPIGLVVIAIAGLIAAGVLLYQHWDEVKVYALQIWESIKAIISDFIEGIKTVVSNTLTAIKTKWESVWSGIKEFATTTWNDIKTLIHNVFMVVYSDITERINLIKNIWEFVWSAIKDFASDIWENIKETVSTIISDVHDKITTTVETIRSAIEEKLNAIKLKWDEIWNGVKKSTEDIFSGMWEFIKGIINSIISGVEKMANGVVRAINKMIDALNGLSFDIPDWVPGDLGGKSFGLDISKITEVSIPRLAQGGFVKANTPQLAMIGDNRHYGEIVAPEDKMQDMVNRAVAMTSQNNSMSDQYLAVMVDLLKKIVDLIEAMDLTVNIDIREIKRKLVELNKRSGYTMKPT